MLSFVLVGAKKILFLRLHKFLSFSEVRVNRTRGYKLSLGPPSQGKEKVQNRVEGWHKGWAKWVGRK